MGQLEIVSQSRSFNGTQFVYRHNSTETRTPMRFSAYVPPQVQQGSRAPVVWWLSGLTCTEENFTVKAGAQRVASELGLIVIAPDTRSRAARAFLAIRTTLMISVVGAGFSMCDADCGSSRGPRNYRMRSYIEKELPTLVEAELPADMSKQGIMGHSMGGHGALTIALRNPGRFKAVSALGLPFLIADALRSPLGRKGAWPAHPSATNHEAWKASPHSALRLEEGEA